MSKAPIEMMLEGITWVPVDITPDGPDNSDGFPFVTHQGVLNFGNTQLRVYQLSNGVRVIDAGDLEQYFSDIEAG